MTINPSTPLIPAKAGTQIEKRRPPISGPKPRDLGQEPYDLGPGLRRDEREGGSERERDTGDKYSRDIARQTVDPRALLRLLSWLSPAFPVGSFGYSHGLEQVIADHKLDNVETLLSWISTLLDHGGGWTDAVLLKEAFEAARADDGSRLQALVELAQALAPSLERLRETRDQGSAFLSAARTWADATGAPPPRLTAAPYPVAVGSCAADADLPLDQVLPAYLHAFASNLVTIAVRAVPLGQTAGVSVIARLEGVILSAAARAAASTLDDLGGCAFGSDIASMRHETLETRLFIT